MCAQGVKPSMIGILRAASASSDKSSHVATSRTMPAISVPHAIISDELGVKSSVTSIRSPRGRTPTPVDSRFAASSMTGAGRMYVSSRAI